LGLASLIRRPGKLSPETLRKAKPMRNPLVEEAEADGILTLRGPAVLRGVLGKLLSKASNEPITKQYELEEIGAFVWSQIDGRRTFQTLSQQLQTKYKMNRLEADTSLQAFLQMLAQRGLVTLMVKEVK
jgi:hypothetical protein